MKGLNSEQLKRASAIIGSISVAWFSAGVVSPIIVQPENIYGFLFSFGVSLSLAAIFFVLSLQIIKGVKQ